MPEYVWATHDFVPENQDEVSFRAGERIEIIEKDDVYGDGWWQGINQYGAVGLFPRLYTTSENPNPSPPALFVQELASSVHTPTTLHSLREEPENISINGSPDPAAIATNGTESSQNGEVMKATMTDVQQAIEQLGNKNDVDGARSFSFASYREGDWTDRESNSETEEDSDAEGEAWHSSARQKLAEKARKANQKAAEVKSTPMRMTVPPIEVELSEESEGEEDDPPSGISLPNPHIPEEDENSHSLSSPISLPNPHIPEEDENDNDLALSQGGQTALKPIVSWEGLVSEPMEEESVPTAQADEPWSRNDSMLLPSPTKFKTDVPLATVNQLETRHSASSIVASAETGISQTLVHNANGLPYQQTIMPATVSPLWTTDSLQQDSSTSPKTSSPSEWTVDEVVDWLKSKGFDQPTCDKFIEQEITGDVLMELNIELLKTEIGIPAFGKRKRIANLIEELKQPPSIFESSQTGTHSRTLSSAHQSLNSPSVFATSQSTAPQLPSVASLESPPHTGDITRTPLIHTRKASDPVPPRGGGLAVLLQASSRTSLIGLGINFTGKNRPASLALSPSDSALNAHVSSDNVITMADDERTAMSENELPGSAMSKASKRRVFGRPLESPSVKSKDSKDAKDSSSRNSKEISTPLTSSTKLESIDDGIPPARHRVKKSIDTNKPSDRLSLFTNTFGGALGKSRKPAPKYSGSFGEKPDLEKDKTSTANPLSKMYHFGERKVSADSTARKKSKESDVTVVKDKDKEQPALLRKRTLSNEQDRAPEATVPGVEGLKAGLSVLEQIGNSDYNGWMHKKSDGYNVWKHRYFVLKGPHLYWLKSNSKTETKIKGYINISGYKIEPNENIRPGSYAFKMWHDGDKTHYFSSEAQVVIRDWMKALKKSTIGRDYTKPVISSVNIPTIPLSVAQAMSPPPRPPSPTSRDATQRASRRSNPNQLSSRDAQILLMGVVPGSDTPENGTDRAQVQSFFANDLIPSPLEITEPQTPVTPKSKAPPRPSRELRAFDSVNSQDAYGPIDDSLIDWVNSHVPQTLHIVDPTGYLCGGLTLLRLAESIKGKPAAPPVPDSAFPSNREDDKLDGLFRLFDFLLDNDVRIGSVSINDVRQGKREKIIQLLKALKAWEDRKKSVEMSIGNGTGTSVPFISAADAMPWSR